MTEPVIQLRHAEVYPASSVLEGVLGRSHIAFGRFMEAIGGPDYALMPEWRYYKDGKAWLCKISYKKKTICWLSAWNGFFKVSFYFTEKTKEGISGLKISEEVKGAFAKAGPAGKLIPLIVDVKSSKQLKDLLAIVTYKLSGK